jgi:hypothetical protein
MRPLLLLTLLSCAPLPLCPQASPLSAPALSADKNAEAVIDSRINQAKLVEQVQEAAKAATTAAQAAASAAALAAAQTSLAASNAAAVSRSQNTALLITTIGGFVGLILTFVIKEVSESRQHAWARDDAKEKSAQLSQIHTLVNSNMTAAMESELDARKSNLILLEETISLKRSAGAEPTGETMVLMSTAKNKIHELEAQLDDRLKQTKIAEKNRAEAEAKR